MPSPTRRPGGAWRRIGSLLILALTAVFLARTAGRVGWRSLGERMSGADPGYLSLAALTIVAKYSLWGKRWQLMMRPVLRAPWLAAQRALMASVFFNTVIPAARPFGGLVRARYLSRGTGIPFGTLYGTTLLDQTGYSVMSLLLGSLSLPFAMWPGGLARRPTLLPALLLLVSLALLLAWRRRSSLQRWLGRRVPAASGAIEGTVEAAGLLIVRPATWLLIPAGGAAVWYASAVALSLSARSVGAEFGFAGAAAAWALGSFVGVASGTPGGVGTTESAALVPLLALGVPADQALAAILLSRGIEYFFTLSVGGLCALVGAGGTRKADTPGDGATA